MRLPTCVALPILAIGSLLGQLTSCASAPPARSPESNPPSPDYEVSAEAQTPESVGDPIANSAPQDAVHPRATCTTGQCFECGSSNCLPGFYCDEAIRACGWLPQCVDAQACKCILEQLPSCTCETRNGNTFVTCPD